MESTNLKEAIAGLNVLKKDAQKAMKKGLPFVLASVVIWGLILVVQSLDLDLSVKNMCVSGGAHKKDAVHDVSFDVRSGEIVCIAGIDGNGQSELI